MRSGSAGRSGGIQMINAVCRLTEEEVQFAELLRCFLNSCVCVCVSLREAEFEVECTLCSG